MYVEEATWLRRTLAGLELPEHASVINVGSSTERYRTVEQPHNEREVLGPLRERGASITHLDAKRDVGVDIVVDLNDPEIDLRASAGQFDLVLATSLLAHLDPAVIPNLARELRGLVRPSGYLVMTTPEIYRQTLDPHDFGYRLTPGGLSDLACGDRFAPVVSESVRIDDPRYYKGVATRPSRVPYRGRWIPLPGASEQIRLRVPRWRWRESCVACRAPAAG